MNPACCCCATGPLPEYLICASATSGDWIELSGPDVSLSNYSAERHQIDIVVGANAASSFDEHCAIR